MIQYKDFFNTFLQKEIREFVPFKRKLIGLEIEKFSDVLGRILIVGNITYMSNKSFRCNKAFDKYKEENKINKKVFICLTDSGYKKNFYIPFTSTVITSRRNFSAGNLKTLDNFFVNQEIPKSDFYIFGICERIKKFYRNKQMYIKASKCMIYNKIDDKMFISESTTFDSIFRSSMKETDQEDRVQ